MSSVERYWNRLAMSRVRPLAWFTVTRIRALKAPLQAETVDISEEAPAARLPVVRRV